MSGDTIRSFADLHEIACELRAMGGWAFRGQGDASWKLAPKAGRPPFSRRDDAEAFAYWKFCAVEHLSSIPGTDWEWLAVAQHHGLITRLLDWSYNPLVAAFFAVRENIDADAVLAAVKCTTHARLKADDPMSFLGVGRFTAKRVVSRIARQSGAFTIHGPPTIEIEETGPDYEFRRYVIDRSYRNKLLRELEHLYVHEAALFPDLDGLSTYVNWKWKTQTYWHKEKRVPENA